MFEGAYTALVTPFTKSGAVDFQKLRDLVEIQVAGGIDGIVPVGTTGESPTLDYAEHEKVVEEVIAAARKRVKVIAGTGGNSTSEALELTRHARDAGADGTLQVTPYYNKPTPTGLVRHFAAVADLGLPVILYNVPGRTGCEIPIDTIVKLSEHPKIAAVKEAAGSVDRVSHLVRRTRLDILSGDDSLTLPMMAVGAKGVISVASNLVPADVARLVHLARDGRWDEARALHLKLHRLFCDLFIETNPLPIKAAMAMRGMIEEVYRLPLCEMQPANRAKLGECLKEIGIL